MAINQFSSHVSEVGVHLANLRDTIGELDLLLNRHTHNGYSGLTSPDFDTELVTKAQYDAAMVSILNLIGTWLPAGHGTNIDGYLYEIP